jgi:hypothetical protein
MDRGIPVLLANINTQLLLPNESGSLALRQPTDLKLTVRLNHNHVLIRLPQIQLPNSNCSLLARQRFVLDLELFLLFFCFFPVAGEDLRSFTFSFTVPGSAIRSRLGCQVADEQSRKHEFLFVDYFDGSALIRAFLQISPLRWSPWSRRPYPSQPFHPSTPLQQCISHPQHVCRN